MKKVNKLIAIILVMALVFLSACGNSEKSSGAADTTDKTTDTAVTTDANTDTTTDAEESEEMAEVTLMVMSLGAMGDGKDAVEEGVNAITEKEINTHVTLKYIEVGSYTQQLGLAVAGNEKVDICITTPIPGSNFSSLIAQNQLMPLDDLLTQYAPEAKTLLGDYLKGTTVNGKIYALPNYRNMASDVYLLARKDIVEGVGMGETFNNMKTWSEYETILQAIKDKGEVAGVGNTDTEGNIMALPYVWLDTDNFADSTIYDTLGDSYKIIGVGEDGKVYSYFESEKYKAVLTRVQSWNQKGYIYADAATSEESADNLIKTNVAASIIKAGEMGVEAALKGTSGYDILSKKLATPPLTTGSLTKFDWAIPVCSTAPEAAAKFLNLMFTNKDINNLLAWGVEGRDYVVVDGVAKYPEGVTPDKVAYHTADFLYGNQFLVTPWDGNEANARDIELASFKSAALSPFLGFSCDTTKVANQLTAINNVLGEFKGGLESGVLGMKEYDAFIKKLKDAGIDQVVAEYQTQLDAWKAQ